MDLIKSIYSRTPVLVFVTLCTTVGAETVTVFDHNNGGGDSTTLDVISCTAMPRGWLYRVSSLLLHKSACLELHSTRLCTDAKPLIISNLAGESNLVDLSGEYQDFNDKLLAIKQCSPSTRSAAISDHIREMDYDDDFSELLVSLYEFVDRKGKKADLVVYDCKNVFPPMYKNVASVNTHDACVRLYSGPSCTGESVQIQKTDTIGSMNLHHWNFLDKVASVGTCAEHQLLALTLQNKLRHRHQVPPLILSETLNRGAEEAAKILANQVDEPNQSTFTSGVLIYSRSGASYSNSASMNVEAAINSWYSQRMSYDSRNPVPSAFTQLVSPSAKEFGIGFAASARRMVVVAIYYPAENSARGFHQQGVPRARSNLQGF